MDFLHRILQVVSLFTKPQNKVAKARSLQIESLENREMLAVSILAAPITAYAGTTNAAEIRFDLTTDSAGSSKLDFIVQSGSDLDPAKLRLLNLTTGKEVSLTNITDGTTSSLASAVLGAGAYSLVVSADSGAGYFTLDIRRDPTASTVDPALPVLVEAALAEQQEGWATRKIHYNKILSYYPGYGANTLNGKKVIEQFPEVDVNGDGKVDQNDYTLSVQLVAVSSAVLTIVGQPAVVNQDTTGPSITSALKNDTGTAGDKITVDTTIVGRITDTNGIQSAQYKLDNGAWVSLALDANGNYTIAHQVVASGSHTITVKATDNVGNLSSTTTTFVCPDSVSTAFPSLVAVSGSTGVVSLPNNLTLLNIEGVGIASGSSLTLSGNKGTVSLSTNGVLTFSAGSYYDKLALGQKENLALTIIVKDEHDRQATQSLTFEIVGKNDLPYLSNTAKPALTVEEGKSGNIAAATLLANWSDSDQGATLSPVNVQIASVNCSNTALKANFTAAALAQYLSSNASGVAFDASNVFFQTLGLGDTLVLTVQYRVSDGTGTSTDTGTLTFTITGKDNASVLTATNTNFDLSSNDLNNPVKAVAPGFSVTDPDQVDAAGTFTYSLKSCSDTTAGLIVNFDTNTGTFKVDTSKLANRNVAAVLTLIVSVKNASGVSVEKTLTVRLTPLASPTATNVVLQTPETIGTGCTVQPTVSGTGFKTDNLVLISGVLPSGTTLAHIASLDAQGVFQFNPGTRFQYLAAGQVLDLVFQYTITDTQYGLSGTSTIALKVIGTATQAITPSNGVIGQNGQYKAVETVGTAPAISVSRTDLLAGWTFLENTALYSVVVGTVRFDAWSGGGNSPFASGNYGTVSLDSQGNLVFTPTADFYTILGVGQWIDLAVDYSVLNTGGGAAVPGGTVLFRIEGQNDTPTLVAQVDSFTVPSNPLADIVLDPRFTAYDYDLNNVFFSYEMDTISYNKGFRVDSVLGQISITKQQVAALDGDQTITITLRDSHSGTVAEFITITVYREPNPTVEDVYLALDENGTITKDLNEAITKQAGNVYSISGLNYIGSDQSFFPNGFDPMSLVQWNNGSITFSTGNHFDTLSVGETLTLLFEFTVSNDGFSQCQTTRCIEIVVSGSNDRPTFDTEGAKTPLSVNASKSNTIDWAAFFSDIDRADSLSLSKINGQAFVNGVLDLNGIGRFQLNGNTLTFTPSTAFDFLAEGVSAASLVNLVLTVVDNQGAAVNGTILLDIQGTNKSPTLAGTNVSVGVNRTVVFSLADLYENGILNDTNTADTHQFYSVTIEGKRLDAQNGTIVLDNGITVVLDILAGTLTMDTTTRNRYPLDGKPETISLAVIVSDGKNENPLSNAALWNVTIGTTAPKVDSVTIPALSETGTAVPPEVKLDDYIFDTNLPDRSGTANWYAILNFDLTSATIGGVELSTEQYALIRSFWNYGNGKFFLNAPNGYFDFLSEGETLVLTFSYRSEDALLRDAAGNKLSSAGTITMSVLGVNTAPTLALDGNLTDKLSNSGWLPNDIFNIGQFTSEDVDRKTGEARLWSVEKIVSGLSALPNGAVVVDANGKIALDNSKLPQPGPGEDATITFDVVVRDGFGAEARQTVSITLYGKQLPLVLLENMTTTESEGDMTLVHKIDVTDPTEPFMDPRSGNDWYTTPEIVSVTPSGHVNDFPPSTLVKLFEIIGNVQDGYSVRFNGTKADFAPLNAGEILDFDVSLTVQDIRFGVETLVSFTCRIEGVGDEHIVVVSEEDRTLEFWSNETGVLESFFVPVYEITELDQGESHYFELGNIIGDLPPDFDKDTHITVDRLTGEITLLHEAFTGLKVGSQWTFTVLVTGENDGIAVPVTFTLTARVAGSPDVDALAPETMGEDGTLDLAISVRPPADNAPRNDNGWYAVSAPVLDSFGGDLPAGMTVLPSGYVIGIANDRLAFDSHGAFDYLALGESVTLNFSYTVSDTKYSTETILQFSITIEGKNATPVLADNLVFGDTLAGNAPIVYGDESVLLGAISDMILDVDDRDTHSLLSIDGITLEEGKWVSVGGKGQFLLDGGLLYYRAQVSGEAGSENLLEKIRHGQTNDFVFTLAFQDNSGAENNAGSGTITVKVQGINSTPVMKTGDDKPKFELEEHTIKEYSVTDFADDVNVGDSLSFHTFNDVLITDTNNVFRLSDGTTVSFLGEKFDIVRIDTSTRYPDRNMTAEETYHRIVRFTIGDDSGAANATTHNAVYQLIVTGVNDPPVLEDHDFDVIDVSVLADSRLADVGNIDFQDADTPKEYYQFSKVDVENVRIVTELSSPALLSSTIPFVSIENATRMVTLWNLPELSSGQYIVYQFTVLITNMQDPLETATATITVRLCNGVASMMGMSNESQMKSQMESQMESPMESQVPPLGVTAPFQGSSIIEFSAPTQGMALATLATICGWTSEDELLYGNQTEDVDTSLSLSRLDEAFADESLFDEQYASWG